MSDWLLVVMTVLAGGAVVCFVMAARTMWDLRRHLSGHDDAPNDAGPLSTFRTSTLKDLVAHNMVMVDAEKYAVMEEMCRRFVEQKATQ